MSRNPKPTAEELKFIYQLILNGYEESDILGEYAHLYDAGQLMFPYRTDKRFVRECRKELEAALEVAQEHVKKKVDPIIVKRREEHFAKLADIADSLLANDLDSVLHGWSTNRVAGQVIYILTRKNKVGDYYDLTEQQLSERLKENIVLAEHKYERWFFHDCFIEHLRSELPEELKPKGTLDVVKEQPYELIEILRVLAARKTFKGTCPVCKDL